MALPRSRLPLSRSRMLAALGGLSLAFGLLLADGAGCIDGATADCSVDAGSPCGPGFDATNIDALLAELSDAAHKADAGKDAGRVVDAGVDTGAPAADAASADAPAADAADATSADAPVADAPTTDAPADALKDSPSTG